MMAARTFFFDGLRAPRRWLKVVPTAFLVLCSIHCAAPAFAQAASPTQFAAPAAQPPSPANAGGLPQPDAVPAADSAPATPVLQPRNEPDSALHPSGALLPSSLPRDLSPWGMFLNAVPIVQAVMVTLAFASLVTWTVWLAKTIELWNARKLARRSLAVLASAASLHAAKKTLAQTPSPVVRFAAAAAEEASQSKGLSAEGVKDRAAALISRIEAQAGRKITRGMGILATIGATAVFVGLFGTVWGIMDSFIGISRTNTTNLAVVAPGIAEALQATAMGLVAAIPAVVMYNAFARSIASYRGLLGDAAAEVLRHLSRDLDRAAAARHEDDAAILPLRQSAE
jgi:biopolymer transport protein ExbB